jgi:hypothetical protein
MKYRFRSFPDKPAELREKQIAETPGTNPFRRVIIGVREINANRNPKAGEILRFGFVWN